MWRVLSMTLQLPTVRIDIVENNLTSRCCRYVICVRTWCGAVFSYEISTDTFGSTQRLKLL